MAEVSDKIIQLLLIIVIFKIITVAQEDTGQQLQGQILLQIVSLLEMVEAQ